MDSETTYEQALETCKQEEGWNIPPELRAHLRMLGENRDFQRMQEMDDYLERIVEANTPKLVFEHNNGENDA